MSATDIWNPLTWLDVPLSVDEYQTAVATWFKSALANGFDRINVVPLYEALKNGKPIPPRFTDPVQFEIFFRCEILPHSHSRRFLAQYGDILRFPIPPECCKMPDERFLKLVWMLKPASLISMDELENHSEMARRISLSQHIQRVRVAHIAINDALPVSEIRKALLAQVDSLLAVPIPGGLQGRQIKESTLESLSLWKEKQRTGHSHKHLGLDFKWSRPSKVNTEEDEREGRDPIDRAKGRVGTRLQRFIDDWVSFFRRPIPDQYNFDKPFTLCDGGTRTSSDVR